MIRLGLRCTPVSGPPDLEWLADLTGSLNEIYDFLLHAEITEQVGRERDLRPEELARVVDGHAAAHGSPGVHVRDGSVGLELVTRLVDGTLPVRVLASVALLFTGGPEVDAWPPHVRRAWYGSQAAGAVRAKDAYQRICRRSRIAVVDDGWSYPAGAPAATRAHGQARAQADLADSVHVAPPLQD